jgi:GR25 family glycosyltransferase involved in LPS biosynthesis
MFEQLEIFYINLEHRIDRKIEIESELKKLKISNYIRFNAIKDENGALGCASSHLKVYEQASGLKPLMVLEDDCAFLLPKSEIENLISLFFNSKADILCLGFNIPEKPYKSILRQFKYNLLKPHLWTLIFGKIRRRTRIQTTSCYIAKPHMIPILISVAKNCVRDLNNGVPTHIAAIDQAWKILQKKYIFVVPSSRAAIQRNSFSDIENVVKDYGV